MEIKPQAMAIPKETTHLAKGKYGPIFPKTPACYGFTIVAKIIPGREPIFYQYAQIKDDIYFMYQGIFDTDFDKYTEDAVALFNNAGLATVFENLDGFPTDWRTNPQAFIRFVRDHQCPSFLEYAEYPFFSADEIKKALKIKSAVSEMLDQLQ